MAEEEPPARPHEDNVIAFPTLDVRAARRSQAAQEVIKDLYESRETADAVITAVIRTDGGVEFGCSNMTIARAIWLATYLRLRIEKEMAV